VRRLAIAFVLFVAAAAAAADLFTPAEKRGREIYLHGNGGVRPITAFFGSDQAGQIDASVVPCASCHGADGRGVAEGTVAPADIRWSVLSQPYVSDDGGRHRPRYDAALLGRAVRDAADAAGTPLYAVMPRYRIEDRDLSDLMAYIRRLGNEPQPGLEGDAVTVGTVVPLSGPRTKVGEAMRDVISGYFDDVNEGGGLFGRKLKLQAIDSDAPSSHIAAALGGPIFGVVGASWSSDDQAYDDVVANERIPLVTPFATGPESRSAVSSFFIFPDLESQVLALIDSIVEKGAKPATRIAIVHDGSKLSEAAASAAERRCTSIDWIVVKEGSAGVDVLLLIGNADIASAAKTTQSRQVLVAGGSISKSLFDLQDRSVFVAVPSLPSDVSKDGTQELASFITRHHLDPAHRAAEIAAYAAVKIFVEAVRQGGRDVTREKVIASLEHFYGYATEVTPLITYGPNRHVGSLGAYIVGIDFDRKTFAPPSRWITPAD